MPAHRQAYRCALLHSLGDPAVTGLDGSYQYWPDGLLQVEDGHIVAAGDANEALPYLPPGIEVEALPGRLIMPGFVDTHIHLPQLGMIGAFGEQLLDWLNHYTFPCEARFADPAHAQDVARRFIAELLRNGTSTALVFASVHPASVEAFFEEALRLGLRMLCGKVMMDRNAPPELLDGPDHGYAQSRDLIERWHGRGRLHYAVTPRFAPTSSAEQLEAAGRLLREYPSVYLHTHLSENRQEIDWVRQLFPERAGYLDVYAHHGLLGPRSVLAHGVHLDGHECAQLAAAGAAVAFCPTSNLFLGSGLFNLPQAERHQLKVGLGTDVGAGTSFSILQTLNEAYKVMQLQGASLHPFKSLYLATLGGARALSLDDRIGQLRPGHEADFVVLDLAATPLLEYRLRQCRDITETLFVLMTLGDDRVIERTYAHGNRVHQRG
ncbi:guanine deaminase [Pseudomonas sp. KNUC1026]|uniref:guanine deaminase n=1 Tax=Pseudomonas sp. KNUC1026 TaxID=2893890 RepID=UPI001F4370DA|nr:guanine deaminase [Pseudomonas sp. KNUC1026]UFH48294.1 guanine deaminase [Pseudomonas sp. KNUC1026]